MWEASILAAAKKLDNLCVIIDDNNSVGAMVDMGNMETKLKAFGFDVYSVNGHDMNALKRVFHQVQEHNGKPKAIIAKTVRGYGSKTMMEDDIWFHKAPNEEELKILYKEVDEF